MSCYDGFPTRDDILVLKPGKHSLPTRPRISISSDYIEDL